MDDNGRRADSSSPRTYAAETRSNESAIDASTPAVATPMLPSALIARETSIEFKR